MSSFLGHLLPRRWSPKITRETIAPGRPTCGMTSVHLTIISTLKGADMHFQFSTRVFLENDQTFRALQTDCSRHLQPALEQAKMDLENASEWVYSIYFETVDQGMQREVISGANWEWCRGVLLDQGTTARVEISRVPYLRTVQLAQG